MEHRDSKTAALQKKSGKMLEEILDRRNLEKALKAVISNKGSGGVDGMQTDELRDYLTHHYQVLKQEILEGNYGSVLNVGEWS